ncbi:MAG: translocation/assembly module TamB, partial [Alphaproteobacteria bacterium]|nr:translocation/assembly module TamB [Alphaproteobacteria bacterium]
DVLTGEATGTLALAGRGGDARLSGAIKAAPVSVDLGEPLPRGVARIDVTHVNAPPGLAIAPPPPSVDREQAGGAFELALDVGVEVERAAVRGRGLQSEWEGDLRLGGTAAAPTVTGALELVRGTYELLGRPFALTRGKIAFAGAERIDPTLDVVAESEASDITAQVVVAGSVREPKIEISSDPPLPSDEVMARLLFGKGVGQLDVGQQVQLARAAAGLAGGAAGSFDPVGDLRGALGLDVLEVGMAGEDEDEEGGGPTVSAGKYIGDDVFVRVDQGDEGTNFTVEMDLGAGFSVDTEVGAQTGGGVGLNWKRDY